MRRLDCSCGLTLTAKIGADQNVPDGFIPGRFGAMHPTPTFREDRET